MIYIIEYLLFMFCVIELVVFEDPEEKEPVGDADEAEAPVHPDITLEEQDQGKENAPKLFSTSNRPSRKSIRKRKALEAGVDDIFNFEEEGMSYYKLICVKYLYSPDINLPREFKHAPV